MITDLAALKIILERMGAESITMSPDNAYIHFFFDGRSIHISAKRFELKAMLEVDIEG